MPFLSEYAMLKSTWVEKYEYEYEKKTNEQCWLCEEQTRAVVSVCVRDSIIDVQSKWKRATYGNKQMQYTIVKV